MNTNSGKYRENQHSGIDWLGTIPKHWKVRRLKFISKVQSSSVDKKSKEDEDEVLLCNYVDVYKNEFIDDSIEFMKATAPQRHIEQFTLIEGNIIITKDSEDRFDIAVPAKVNKDFDNVLCGYHLALIRADYEQIDPDFLFRWFQSDLVNDQFKVSANGITRYGLSVCSIKDSVVAVPPIPEQKAIATFLDQQTTRIDQLIEKKKRILELLDEQRQATITRAVTKGIAPNAKMKESGIEWLDDVPEHWDVTKVKFTGSIKYGLGEPPEKLEGGLPFIRATDIYRGVINSDKIQYINPDAVPWSRKPELKAKDILVVRSGAYTGDSAIVPDEWEGAIAGYDMVYTCKTADPEFVANAFLSKYVLEAQFHIARSRAAQPHLNAEELGNCILLLPPMNEQRAIVAFLKKMTTKLDYLKSKIIKAIDHLEEYRSSLITQAVTGKIDVRNVVSEQALSYAAEVGESYTTN